jgi:cytochrome P450
MPTLKVILLGGMQEPGHGAGSTLAGLLSEPSQLAAAQADPGLLPAVIEEGLRWVSPIGTQTRQVAADTELAGVRLPQGAPVGSLVSSANRDETKFPDPDRFDIFRPRGVNIAFGTGRHFCAGHAFSRALIKIAIEELLGRFPRLALNPERPPNSAAGSPAPPAGSTSPSHDSPHGCGRTQSPDLNRRLLDRQP